MNYQPWLIGQHGLETDTKLFQAHFTALPLTLKCSLLFNLFQMVFEIPFRLKPVSIRTRAHIYRITPLVISLEILIKSWQLDLL